MGSAFGAVGLLTIVPVPAATSRDTSRLGRAAAFFPLVGLLLGAAAAALDAGLRQVLPISVASAIVLVVLALATGGLHLDGLADTADGLFARGGRTERLAAMRDSRTGAFGVGAIALVLLTEFAALERVGSAERATALVVGATLSRGAMAEALRWFAPARADGLAAAFARGVRGIDAAVAGAVMALVAGALAPAGTAIVALSLALGVAIAVGSLARVRVGGITGDVCGAIGEIVFACELVAFSAGHA